MKDIKFFILMMLVFSVCMGGFLLILGVTGNIVLENEEARTCFNYTAESYCRSKNLSLKSAYSFNGYDSNFRCNFEEFDRDKGYKFKGMFYYTNEELERCKNLIVRWVPWWKR